VLLDLAERDLSRVVGVFAHQGIPARELERALDRRKFVFDDVDHQLHASWLPVQTASSLNVKSVLSKNLDKERKFWMMLFTLPGADTEPGTDLHDAGDENQANRFVSKRQNTANPTFGQATRNSHLPFFCF